jgi:transcriptional regulator with XRE-family HTH domain
MNIIKEVLKKEGKSAVWLAQKTKISKASIFNYTANKRDPSTHLLNRIARELNTKKAQKVNRHNKTKQDDVFEIVSNIALPGRGNKR